MDSTVIDGGNLIGISDLTVREDLSFIVFNRKLNLQTTDFRGH